MPLPDPANLEPSAPKSSTSVHNGWGLAATITTLNYQDSRLLGGGNNQDPQLSGYGYCMLPPDPAPVLELFLAFP